MHIAQTQRLEIFFKLGVIKLKISGYLRQILILMKNLTTIGLLVMSNIFMTFAWYGHLKFKEMKGFDTIGLFLIVIISWSIALFEYMFQVPANRIGYAGNGGPYSLVQLKVLQEVITLLVFVVFSLLVFKNETFRLNHLIGFVFLVMAVYFIFKK
jgi:hypothetical protein